MNRAFRMTLSVAAGLALLGSSPARAQDEGVKQVQRLVKSSGETVQAIGETKLQIQKTLDTYNALLGEDASKLRNLYKGLQKEMEGTAKKRAEIDSRSEVMQQDANTLFESWASSATAIENEDLRARSLERLATTKERFAEIEAVGRKAGELYDPFMKSLGEQVTYLGHDLNAEALASLKPDAEKLNQKAKELLAAIDDAIGVANKNIGMLRPQ